MKYVLLLLVCVSALLAETELASFVVESGNSTRINTPTCVVLTGIQFNLDDGDLYLYETTHQKTWVPCQLENGVTPTLWFILAGTTQPHTQRKFLLVQGESAAAPSTIKVQQTDSTLAIFAQSKPVLQYYMAEHKPPTGVSSIFNRSGFIHPLYSPNGAVLSRVCPPDHWHHVGIWNPWTKTHFQGRDVDFWNIGDGTGTVKFAGLLGSTSGPVFGGFQVLQDHVDFTAPGTDLTAMHEVWDVRVWHCSDSVFVVDLYTTLSCATDSSIELAVYRYGGGLGFRAHEDWTNENVHVLTSEGLSRKDADGTSARWCDVSGESAGQRSGILFASHPQNRQHPEPMRIWPLDANNGRGDMFFEFCPIRHKAWHLFPGKQYVLKYRMYVYDGEIAPEIAELVWQDFANPPIVTINRRSK